MPEFTIVTACTPAYVPSLFWAAPTWIHKPQFAAQPLAVFHHGFRPGEAEKRLAFLDGLFPSLRLIEWPMPAAETERERMLSAFVLGAAQHVHTDHFCKLDADVYFTSPADVWEPGDFELDLCARRWGYTKPAWFLDRLEAWAKGEGGTGRVDTGTRRADRIISYCCLHKTDFVRKAAELAGDRLPVPSHDTYLWWLAENCKDFRWGTRDMASRGVVHGRHDKWRRVRDGVCERGPVWNPVHNAELLSHVQIEITLACNLACPNCDRACGIAPTGAQMTREQIGRFVAECNAAGKRWGRIDILGGEPCLHPDLLWILDQVRPLVEPGGDKVRLTTNGTGEQVRVMLAKVPPWVSVRNSAAEKPAPNFVAVNCAPCDAGHDTADACSIPWRCGLCLNPCGYFLCGAGAGAARVFGLDCGLPRLADVTPDTLRKQRDTLCRLCGHSASCRRHTTKQEMSPAWESAVKMYKTRTLGEY